MGSPRIRAFTQRAGTFLQRLPSLLKPLNSVVEFTDRQGVPLRLPLGWILLVALLPILWFGVFDALKLRPKPIPPTLVWEQAQAEGQRVGLDPGFIYAICWAESSLDAHARSEVARGLMQMTRSAWGEVRAGWYGRAFNWKRNMRAGVDYLSFCRDILEASGNFSYPRLAAAYRYGPYALQSVNFDLGKMPTPRNYIYRQLFAGELQPVQPPD